MQIPLWLPTWGEAGLVLLQLLAIALAAFILRRLLRLLTRRMIQLAETQSRSAQQREQQTQTVADLLYSTGSAVILVGAILVALPLVGVNVTPIAAVAGLASLAFGFGAQHLVRDVINGFFIVLEDQYVVGETVRIGAVSGRVEGLTLRRTVLRDPEGALHTIPNGEIRTLANLSRDWSQLFVDVALDPADRVDRALAALEGVCAEFRADSNWSAALVDGPRVLGVESLVPGSALLRVQIRTGPARQHDAARELRRRIRARFEQERLGAGAHRIEIVGAPAEK
jgi:small conductance mechanosensitive channel